MAILSISFKKKINHILAGLFMVITRSAQRKVMSKNYQQFAPTIENNCL